MTSDVTQPTYDAYLSYAPAHAVWTNEWLLPHLHADRLRIATAVYPSDCGPTKTN